MENEEKKKIVYSEPLDYISEESQEILEQGGIADPEIVEEGKCLDDTEMADFIDKNWAEYEKAQAKPLPPLPEDERIYLNVTYDTNSFAKYAHCGYDPKKKLWFTGPRNKHIGALIQLYGINKATSKKALELLSSFNKKDS